VLGGFCGECKAELDAVKQAQLEVVGELRGLAEFFAEDFCADKPTQCAPPAIALRTSSVAVGMYGA
jgi:hypothetical protein